MICRAVTSWQPQMRITLCGCRGTTALHASFLQRLFSLFHRAALAVDEGDDKSILKA